MIVVKRSGDREPFDRAKIVVGVRLATGRPVTAEQLDLLAADVEDAVRLEGAEISSDLIGATVLQGLRKLDEVAYLRFASVHKSFDDVEDFQRGALTERTRRGRRRRPRLTPEQVRSGRAGDHRGVHPQVAEEEEPTLVGHVRQPEVGRGAVGAEPPPTRLALPPTTIGASVRSAAASSRRPSAMSWLMIPGPPSVSTVATPRRSSAKRRSTAPIPARTTSTPAGTAPASSVVTTRPHPLVNSADE